MVKYKKSIKCENAYSYNEKVKKITGKEVLMFEKGEYIHYGNSGVCIVDDVTTMKLEGVDQEKQYYVLAPLWTKGNKIYTPVDGQKVVIRKILTETEALELIDQMPLIEELIITNDREREDRYKEAMRSGDCRAWVSVLKTLHTRKLERQAAGKKVTSADERYMKAAEDQLYGELAAALNLQKDQMEQYISERMEAV